MTNSSTKVFALLAVVVAVLLQSLNLYFGELNQDEGWYLYAAQNVSDGRLPYRDYAYTQAPLMPLIYAAFSPLVREGGIGAGRAVTAVIGLGAALLAALLARRLVRSEAASAAGVLAFTLCAVNVYQSYFTTVVKTYSLCGCLLAAGMLVLVAARGPALHAISGALFVLAGATRISAGVAVPVVCLYFFVSDGWKMRPRTWAFGLGAVACAAAVFGPFLLMAPEGFRYGILEYHAARTAGGLLDALVYKAGFISRVVQAYLPAVAILVFLAVSRFNGIRQPMPGVTPVWLVAGAVTLVHFAAPFPYDDYQAVVYPVVCAGAGASLAAWLAARQNAGALMQSVLSAVWLVAVASAFSSPINQDWMIAGRDRIWWRLKEKPALAQLREAGAWIRERTKPGDVLLTQDTYLAVESGLRVPEGMEMGPFCYYPGFSDEKAAMLKVLNKPSMERILASTPAAMAALSGYALSLASPEVTEVPAQERDALRALLDQRFEVERVIPRFGQAQTTLELLRPRGASPSP